MSLTVPATVIALSVVMRFGVGVSIVTCGGDVSSVTVTLPEPAFPPAFFATAVNVLLPSTRGTSVVKVPPESGVAIPLTVTVAFGSLTVPRTVTGLVFVKLKFAGDVRVTRGAGIKVRATVADPTLPAVSAASTAMEDPELAIVTSQLKLLPLRAPVVPLQETLDTPDRESLTV